MPDMTPAIKIPPGSKAPVTAAPQAEFLPQDDYNKKLVGNVGPADYVNPEPLEKYDLVSKYAANRRTYVGDGSIGAPGYLFWPFD